MSVDRYPNAEVVYEGEGGVVLVASDGDDWVVITDEGAMADFLDPVADAALLDSLVKVRHFSDRAARDAYVARRWPRP